MAYTYEQFESEAAKAGLLGKFDPKDLVIARSDPAYGMSMLQLMRQSNTAKTQEQRVLADEAATRLRQDYGRPVTGGRLPLYADEAVQQSQNRFAEDAAYRRALAQVGGYGDMKTDPALTETYTHRFDLEGNRAATDALAAASVRTGGRPSSYALTLAGHTGNDYKGRLQDTINQLRQDAYQQTLQTQNAGSNEASDDRKHAEWLYEQTKDPSVIKPYIPYEQYVLLDGVADETQRVLDLTEMLGQWIPMWKAQGYTAESISRIVLNIVDKKTETWTDASEAELAAVYKYLINGGLV